MCHVYVQVALYTQPRLSDLTLAEHIEYPIMIPIIQVLIIIVLQSETFRKHESQILIMSPKQRHCPKNVDTTTIGIIDVTS